MAAFLVSRLRRPGKFSSTQPSRLGSSCTCGVRRSMKSKQPIKWANKKAKEGHNVPGLPGQAIGSMRLNSWPRCFRLPTLYLDFLESKAA